MFLLHWCKRLRLESKENRTMISMTFLYLFYTHLCHGPHLSPNPIWNILSHRGNTRPPSVSPFLSCWGNKSKERRCLILAHRGCKGPQKCNVCRPVCWACCAQWHVGRGAGWYLSGCFPSPFPFPPQGNYVRQMCGIDRQSPQSQSSSSVMGKKETLDKKSSARIKGRLNSQPQKCQNGTGEAFPSKEDSPLSRTRLEAERSHQGPGSGGLLHQQPWWPEAKQGPGDGRCRVTWWTGGAKYGNASAGHVQLHWVPSVRDICTAGFSTNT